MKKLRFQTNINCGACVRSVTPFLNEVPGVERWQVATEQPDKLLTVEGKDVTADQVRAAVEEAGFSATAVPE